MTRLLQTDFSAGVDRWLDIGDGSSHRRCRQTDQAIQLGDLAAFARRRFEDADQRALFRGRRQTRALDVQGQTVDSEIDR